MLLGPLVMSFAFRVLLASFFGLIPGILFSVSLNPSSFSRLFAMANLLPVSMLSIDQYSDERLWLYSWVPLSRSGEAIGAGVAGGVSTFRGILRALDAKVEKMRHDPEVVGVFSLCPTLSLRTAAVIPIQHPANVVLKFGGIIVASCLISMRLINLILISSNLILNRQPGVGK